MSEIEKRIERIKNNKTVKGLLIVKYKDLKDAQDKIPPVFVKSTFD